MELKNEIENELHELSPYLASLGRQHPFLIPENYFAELEESILLEVSGRMIEGIQVEEVKLPQHPFEVPQGYFDELPSNIISAIRREERTGGVVKSIVIKKRPTINYRPWLAAASVAIIAGLTILFFNNERRLHVTSQPQTATVSSDISGALLLENASDIDESTIVNMLVEQQAEDKKTDPTLSNHNQNADDNSLIDVSDIDPELLDEI